MKTITAYVLLAICCYSTAWSQNNTPQKESIDEIVPWWEQVKKPVAPNMSAESITELSKFFPVEGIELGKTGLEEIESRGYKVVYRPEGNANAAQINRTNLFFLDNDRDEFVDELRIKHVRFPDSWYALGFDWNLSYNEWIQLFQKLDYTAFATEAPHETELVYKYLSATVEALSPSKEVKFILRFTQGEKGHKVTSPGTLQEIDVVWTGQPFTVNEQLFIGRKTQGVDLR